ncbi:hypothetical protein VTL71DRAFT_5002 [Oculimacula yallundae]|uniref:Uncharacterized protein n=1 Tax=Oculimacula yallundae TaxID=86028 RepID=A0ABR4BZW7_9HELO
MAIIKTYKIIRNF